MKSNEDIRALFNITNQLATQVQVQNIILHLRAVLTNLRDCLQFMKQLANHVLEYIDTAITGTLTPHLIPVLDLQQMRYRIESDLPPNMHLPIPSSDPLHFYRYLQMHVLVEENQFLLLIDVPIKDRAQQIQIYQIINSPVPPSCIAALYTKNSREIDRLCELTTKAQPELYLPIPLAPNVWAIISSPFKQQLPVTVICPTKPAALIHYHHPYTY